MRIQDVLPKPTTASIKKAILEYLLARGHIAWRQNNLPVRGRMFVGRKGVPDILGFTRTTLNIHCGMFFGVEVKGPEDRMSEAQLEFQADCKRHQAIYIVAHSLEDVTKEGLGSNWCSHNGRPHPVSGRHDRSSVVCVGSR